MRSFYHLLYFCSICLCFCFNSMAADWNYNTDKVSSGSITVKNANGQPITINANSGGINSLSTVPLIINEGGASYVFDQGVKLTNGKVYVHESNLNAWTEYLASDFADKFTFGETPIYKMTKYAKYASSTINASMIAICANNVYKAENPDFECTLSYTYDSPGGTASPHTIYSAEYHKGDILNVNFGLPSWEVNGVTFYGLYDFQSYSGISGWNCYASGYMHLELQFSGVWPMTSHTSSFGGYGYTYQPTGNTASCSEPRYSDFRPSATMSRYFDASVHYVNINGKEVWVGGEAFAREVAGTLPDGTVTKINSVDYNLVETIFKGTDYAYLATQSGQVFQHQTSTGIVSSYDVATMKTSQVIDLESGVELASFLSNIQMK